MSKSDNDDDVTPHHVLEKYIDLNNLTINKEGNSKVTDFSISLNIKDTFGDNPLDDIGSLMKIDMELDSLISVYLSKNVKTETLEKLNKRELFDLLRYSIIGDLLLRNKELSNNDDDNKKEEGVNDNKQNEEEEGEIEVSRLNASIPYYELKVNGFVVDWMVYVLDYVYKIVMSDDSNVSRYDRIDFVIYDEKDDTMEMNSYGDDTPFRKHDEFLTVWYKGGQKFEIFNRMGGKCLLKRYIDQNNGKRYEEFFYSIARDFKDLSMSPPTIRLGNAYKQIMAYGVGSVTNKSLSELFGNESNLLSDDMNDHFDKYDEHMTEEHERQTSLVESLFSK